MIKMEINFNMRVRGDVKTRAIMSLYSVILDTIKFVQLFGEQASVLSSHLDIFGSEGALSLRELQ